MSADTTTKWLGLDLPHPLMPGASPLVDDLDEVAALQEAGASAIVMHSLFEEQILREYEDAEWGMDAHTETYVEARSYFPKRDLFMFGPEGYVEHVRRLRRAVRVPLIASLNGATPGGWLDFGRALQDAGADALELNVYDIATEGNESGQALEDLTVQMVAALRRAIRVPFAVKLSPFYTSLVHFVRRLESAGADGLVIFNRFYQPDINVDALEVVPELRLSDSSELPLRLRWLAILYPAVKIPIAVTGGVHDPVDAVKSVMCGASAVQVVSALLRHGSRRLAELVQGFRAWLGEHDYKSVAQMKGSMSLQRCPDPRAVERSNYAHLLQTWRRSAAERGKR